MVALGVHARSLETRLRAAEKALELGWAHKVCENCGADMMCERDKTVEHQSDRIASLEAELERVRKEKA